MIVSLAQYFVFRISDVAKRPNIGRVDDEVKQIIPYYSLVQAVFIPLSSDAAASSFDFHLANPKYTSHFKYYHKNDTAFVPFSFHCFNKFVLFFGRGLFLDSACLIRKLSACKMFMEQIHAAPLLEV